MGQYFLQRPFQRLGEAPKKVIESQMEKGIERVQQEVRLRSKARGNQSLHFKLEGLKPRGAWRTRLKVGEEEVEIKEQRCPCGPGEASQFEVCVCESLAPSGCSFVRLGLSGWGRGGFLREETLLNVPFYIFRNSHFASAFRFLLIDF